MCMTWESWKSRAWSGEAADGPVSTVRLTRRDTSLGMEQPLCKARLWSMSQWLDAQADAVGAGPDDRLPAIPVRPDQCPRLAWLY